MNGSEQHPGNGDYRVYELGGAKLTLRSDLVFTPQTVAGKADVLRHVKKHFANFREVDADGVGAVDAGFGERVCVQLRGSQLEMTSAEAREVGESVADAFRHSSFYLVESASLVTCQDALSGS